MMPGEQSFFGFGGQPQGGDTSSMINNPLLYAGLGLLSAGRDRRIDPFQAAAQGLLTGTQMQQRQQQQQLENQQRAEQYGMQRQEFDWKRGQQEAATKAQTAIKERLDLGDQEGAARIAIASGDPQLTAWGGGLLAPQKSASQKDFEAYQKMTPEQQRLYEQFQTVGRKDTTPYFTPLPTSGGYVTFNNRTGQYEAAALPGGSPAAQSAGAPGTTGFGVSPQLPAPRPILPIAADVNLTRDKANAEATGTAQGKNRVEALSDLPRVETNANATLKLLSDLQNHPGREYATGIYSLAPTVPGTKQADFIAMLDQLNGQSFLQAFQSLKGGGQITEIEGKKATDAIQRIKRAQTKEGFDAGVQELRDMITSTTNNARMKTGGQPGGTPPTGSGGWGIQEIPGG